MRIATLIKQIPAFEAMELDPDGRLRRDGVDLEMNPYCRRAVSQATEIAAAVGDGTVAAISLGPPTAEDILREAIAWADEHGVHAEGVLVSDPEFAGSDTLATALALAAVIEREGPFDLVMVGRNSVDADTGQVGPEVAEMLGLPFAGGARHLALDGTTLHLRCEHDDGWAQVAVELPAVVSCAERLIEPCKVDPAGRAAVPAARIRTLGAADLGPGPWGADASPTRVGSVREHTVARDRRVLRGPLAGQVADAVDALGARGALETAEQVGRRDVATAAEMHGSPGEQGSPIGVIVEPDRAHLTRALLGTAASLAEETRGHVVALTTAAATGAPLTEMGGGELASWGADVVLTLRGSAVEEDIAGAVRAWAETARPWSVLAPSTAWGREVAARVAARLGAGLTGDAVALEVDGDGRLVAWKPAFGGQLVAAITATSSVQMATVREGVLASRVPRPPGPPAAPVRRDVTVHPRSRTRVLNRTRVDDLDVLAEARSVVGVGMGVHSSEYAALGPLLAALDAPLGATRKVTDRGWLPRSRQIGLTGRSIAPRLYVAIGLAGKFNHMVGVRAATTILAVNLDADAVVFESCDVGIVGDWHEVVPLLVAELDRAGALSTP